jgi:hypothetical protein
MLRLRRGLAACIFYGMRAARSALAAARAREGRRRRIVATIALTMGVLSVVLSLGAPAQAQPLSVQLWGLLNEKCNDGLPDDPKTVQACGKREQYAAKLQRRGCLFQEDGGWWKCPH